MSPPNLAPHLIFLPEILPETEFLIQRPRPLLRNRPLLRLRCRRGLPLPLRQGSLYVLSDARTWAASSPAITPRATTAYRSGTGWAIWTCAQASLLRWRAPLTPGWETTPSCGGRRGWRCSCPGTAPIGPQTKEEPSLIWFSSSFREIGWVNGVESEEEEEIKDRPPKTFKLKNKKLNYCKIRMESKGELKF